MFLPLKQKTERKGYILVEIVIALFIISILIMTFNKSSLSFMQTLNSINYDIDEYDMIDSSATYMIKMISRADYYYYNKTITRNPIFVRKEGKDTIFYFFDLKDNTMYYRAFSNKHEIVTSNTSFSNNKLVTSIDTLELSMEDKVFRIYLKNSHGIEVEKYIAPMFEEHYEK